MEELDIDFPSAEEIDRRAATGVILGFLRNATPKRGVLNLSIYDVYGERVSIMKSNKLIYLDRDFVVNCSAAYGRMGQKEMDEFLHGMQDIIADSHDGKWVGFVTMSIFEVYDEELIDPTECIRWKISEGRIQRTGELPPDQG